MKKLFFAAAALAAAVATAALAAGDPFDDARYDIGIKKNAEALAIVDGGSFDINTQTDEGYTLLHYAADQGNLEMVRELLKRGLLAEGFDTANRGTKSKDFGVVTEMPSGRSRAGK